MVQGLVRDLRERWSLEEAGLPYEVELIALGPQQASAEYRAWQPFGQVPAYEENGHRLFESGAIVLHIAEKSEAMMPREFRDDVIQWLFASLNTIEVPLMLLIQMSFGGLTEGPVPDKTREWIGKRLGELTAVMKGNAYLVGNRFTAADLMMATVLSELRNTGLLEKEPFMANYYARCIARPAYAKAMADQMRTYAENAPA